MPTAIPASGQYSASDLEAAFPGIGSTGKDGSDYHRGGLKVEDITPNASIPTSGALSASDFLGAKNDGANLSNNRSVAASDMVAAPSIATAVAGFRFEPNGDLVRYDQDGDLETISNEWLQDKRSGAGSDWAIRVDVFNGTLNGASDLTGVWLSLSVARQFEVTASAGSGSSVSKTAELEVAVRDLSAFIRAQVFGVPPLNEDRWDLSATAESVAP